MIEIESLKFDSAGLIPAIIQDSSTRVVLMQGFMNRDSIRETIESGRVCFYSRSRKRLWRKGEESGNFLILQSMAADCDKDSLLVKVIPKGAVCHTGAATCWGEENTYNSSATIWDKDNRDRDFLRYLEKFLIDRSEESPEISYTSRLLHKGINRVAQKVGEEAVELVIEAKDNNRELFLNEAADLIYHYLVLLIAKDCRLEEVLDVLKSRHHPQ